MRKTLFLMLAAFSISAHAGLYKCKVEGVITYSDTPCTDATQRSVGRIDDKPQIFIGKHNSAGGQAPSASIEAVMADPTNDPASRLAAIQSTLAGLETDGQDCAASWDAKALDPEACQGFLKQMSQDSESPWSRANEALMTLLGDQPTAIEHAATIKEIAGSINRVGDLGAQARMRMAEYEQSMGPVANDAEQAAGN